jgi:RHH-type proline utilization regulon transcriptional repressor/proline dehydrogenase/delta 1-pyrroline-5-carboxylate dehydrogenase
VQKDYQRAGLEKALIQIEPMVSLVTLVQNNAVEAVIANSLNTDSAGLRQVMAQRTGSIIPLIEWPKNDVGYTYHWLLSLLTERTRTENLVAKGGNTQLFNLAE